MKAHAATVCKNIFGVSIKLQVSVDQGILFWHFDCDENLFCASFILNATSLGLEDRVKNALKSLNVSRSPCRIYVKVCPPKVAFLSSIGVLGYAMLLET
jgi:hypothetical protein